jgi:membrane associated rhomboid family serine protease
VGLADRDYVRKSPPPSAGFGSGIGRGLGLAGGPRNWPFNTWLIFVNAAIFIVGALLASGGSIPVHIADDIEKGPLPTGKLVIQTEYPRPDGTLAPYLVPGQRGLQPAPVNHVGQQRLPVPVSRTMLVITDDGERIPIGLRRYRLMEPLTALGHFSTAKAFFWQPNPFKYEINLQVWRLITFQFLHSGFLHIFFNMFGLFVFGRMVEQYLGFKRYAAFYLMCGICGGLAYLLLNAIGQTGIKLPGALFNSPTTSLVGASAGVFGVIVASAFIAPNSVVQLIFPPISLKLKWFAYGYVAFAAFNLFIAKGHNQGGDAAHLGGAIAGFFFIRRPDLLREFFDVFNNSSKPRQPKGKRAAKSKPTLRRNANAANPTERDHEIDRILDKIQREGLPSLSDAEKKTLADASSKRRQ